MNPFELMSDKEFKEYIARDEEIETIVSSFDEQSSMLYLIGGVRGSGKTTLLSHISKIYSERKDWIVIALNPKEDLLASLVLKLYKKAGVASLFAENSFSLSIKGVGLTLNSGELLTDEESILEIMLKDIERRNLKVLITIDEVSNNKNMRNFTRLYQKILIKELPLYLLITAQNRNMENFQNVKASYLSIGKLHDKSIYNEYLKVFNNASLAIDMVKCVIGYAFAYQLLGKIVYEQQASTLSDDVLSKFDEAIAEYSYMKIWQECNEMDKKIIKAIFETDGSVANIMKLMHLNKSQFSVYRDRLIKKCFIDTSKRGFLSITLPRFDKFISTYSRLELL